MTTRRKFLKGAAIGAPAAALATPALAQSTITWRLQTYAGAALAAEVVVPAV
ncbi:MAG: twin-arginine translocation signal domain-containing protein, partial [Pseudomonadota bacterium]